MSTAEKKQPVNWRRLLEQPVPAEDIGQSVEKQSIPSLAFYLMLSMSAVIATLGLLANSTAVIIGAMIIAPLMSPVIAVSYGLVSGRWNLIFGSLLTVATGTLLTITIAFFIAQLFGWKLVGSEIITRLQPNLLDLGIALAAGAAAAFAYTRQSISAALAGVAIAVALVPPLCTVGIILARGDDVSPEVGLTLEGLGARAPLLLYWTNIIGIILAASTVFYWQYYRHRIVAMLALVLILVSMIAVVPPLRTSMDNLLMRNEVRRSLTVLALSQLPDTDRIRLTNLKVRAGLNTILVRVDVVAPRGAISQEFADIAQEELSNSIGVPIELEIGIIHRSVLHGSDPQAAQ